jgi:hypothetical protein
VAANGSPYSEEEKNRILADRADALLVEAEQLGVSMEDLINLLNQQRNAFDANNKETG